jgi:acetyltransferase-like isoleucine patch superfamily enzyme
MRALTRRLAAAGPNTLIVPPATILAPDRIELGDRVLVLEHCHFSVVEEHGGRQYSPRLRIGDGTVVGPRTWISCVGAVEIGEDVLIGAGALIADAFHEYTNLSLPILKQPMRDPAPVRVDRGAFIGPGASVLSGVTVGAGAYVMPGAVVVADVPPHSVVAGNPAEAIRTWQGEGGGWTDTAEPRWASLLASLLREQRS